MCSGSEEGSYFRLIDIFYHSTLGLRVIKKRRRRDKVSVPPRCVQGVWNRPSWDCVNVEASMHPCASRMQHGANVIFRRKFSLRLQWCSFWS